MTTIWKYKLSAEKVVELEMPMGAEILSVQSIVNIVDPNPKELAYLWALVNPGNPMEKRRFIIVPTGVDLDDEDRTYIGTFQMESGDVILHVFEEGLY